MKTITHWIDGKAYEKSAERPGLGHIRKNYPAGETLAIGIRNLPVHEGPELVVIRRLARGQRGEEDEQASGENQVFHSFLHLETLGPELAAS